MAFPIYQVDAFADAVFQGNPAAVMPLDSWLDDSLLQAIAMENNLSETAYMVKAAEGYELRCVTHWAPLPVKHWRHPPGRARGFTSMSLKKISRH